MNRCSTGTRFLNIEDFNKQERHVFFLAQIYTTERYVQRIEFEVEAGDAFAVVYIKSSTGQIIASLKSSVVEARKYWKELTKTYKWVKQNK